MQRIDCLYYCQFDWLQRYNMYVRPTQFQGHTRSIFLFHLYYYLPLWDPYHNEMYVMEARSKCLLLLLLLLLKIHIFSFYSLRSGKLGETLPTQPESEVDVKADYDVSSFPVYLQFLHGLLKVSSPPSSLLVSPRQLMMIMMMMSPVCADVCVVSFCAVSGGCCANGRTYTRQSYITWPVSVSIGPRGPDGPRCSLLSPPVSNGPSLSLYRTWRTRWTQMLSTIASCL